MTGPCLQVRWIHSTLRFCFWKISFNSSTYAQFFQAVAFLHCSLPKCCVHFSCDVVDTLKSMRAETVCAYSSPDDTFPVFIIITFLLLRLEIDGHGEIFYGKPGFTKSCSATDDDEMQLLMLLTTYSLACWLIKYTKGVLRDKPAITYWLNDFPFVLFTTARNPSILTVLKTGTSHTYRLPGLKLFFTSVHCMASAART